MGEGLKRAFAAAKATQVNFKKLMEQRDRYRAGLEAVIQGIDTAQTADGDEFQNIRKIAAKALQDPE